MHYCNFSKKLTSSLPLHYFTVHFPGLCVGSMELSPLHLFVLRLTISSSKTDGDDSQRQTNCVFH